MSSEDERIRRVERQLAAAQQITHLGSWEWDARTHAVTWSDELYRIYGFEPRSREITFEFFVSRLHPDDRDRIQHEVRCALERGGRFSYPERIVRPDGEVRELETIGEAVHDRDGRTVGLIGTCRDVTDQRRRDEMIRLYADIVRHVQIGLAVWSVPAPEDPASMRLVAFNPAAEAIARMPLAAETGKSLRAILPYAAGGRLEGLIGEVARHGQVCEATIERSRDPANPSRALTVKAFSLGAGRVGVAIEDVTESMRARLMQDREHRVLEMIASGAPLPVILTTVVVAMEEHSPGSLGSVLLLDGDGAHIRHGAAPNLPEAYVQAIDGATIGPAAGSCGTAAYRRQPVYVDDIEADPLWADYRDLARASGLRACWSTPMIATDGRVLGTFAFYHREPRAPTVEQRQLMDRATYLAGIAIERQQIDDQLRALAARVEAVREEERTGIAREIHDELGQALTALKMDLAWLTRRMTGESSASGTTLLEKIGAMSTMTDELIQHVRRIAADLRPGVLDDLGLRAAIEWEAEQFEERTGTSCRIISNLADEQPMDRDLSTTVFRILQEALTNVARHASAERVDVTLDAEGGALRLVVSDDGRGISPDAARSPKSLGLLGIRERARRHGGSATVTGGSPRGTTVRVELPLAEDRRGRL